MTYNRLSINGSPVDFVPGQTILEAARAAGVAIPTLCHLKHCSPTGACRVCLVEVKGARSLAASCSMPAEAGMEISTDTETVVRARRLNIELLLAMGRHDCVTCQANGDCRLQDLAYAESVEESRFGRKKSPHPTETLNPLIIRDFDRCVMCGRCVQACNDIQVNGAISYGYRGAASKIVAGGDRPLIDSDCVFCGQCVEACPVGALIDKKAKGRARSWETSKVRSTCGYCGVGCQIDLHVAQGRVIRVTSAGEDEVPNQGRLCVKGRYGYDFIHSPDRLTSPLIKDGDGFREASWNEALDLVAARMTAIREEHGPDALAGLTSARITNEENYLVQKLVRAGFGTNNIDHCARL